jgi:hypothetical protein
MHVVASTTPLPVAGFVFVLHGSPWAGLAWLSLALSAVRWPNTGSTRSVTQVIDGIEASRFR